MFSDIANWSMIIVTISLFILVAVVIVLELESDDRPHNENDLISDESWAKARRQLRNKKW